jgi:hypothetical protein
MVSGGAIERQRSKSDDAERPGQRRPAVFIAVILLALRAAADQVIEQPSLVAVHESGFDTFRTWRAGLTMSALGGKADLTVTSADFRN